MRSRRWVTWLIFGVCAILVVDGLGWVTWQVLRLEKREAQAAVESDLEERARLALWRMDSLLTPIIAQESARPYFHYRAFYPADRAYTRVWEEVQPGDVLVASPLLLAARSTPIVADLIRLHYQIEPDGQITSPQVPTGDMLVLAGSDLAIVGQVARSSRLMAQLQAWHEEARLAAERGRTNSDEASIARGQTARQAGLDVQSAAPSKAMEDFTQRRDRFAYSVQLESQKRDDTALRIAAAELGVDEAVDSTLGRSSNVVTTPPPVEMREVESGEVVMGSFRPAWLRTDTAEPELVFVRSVSLGSSNFRQGIWIDWPMLRTILLNGVMDLLPDASLEPITAADEASSTARVLAALPARLESGPVPEIGPLGLTTVRLTLIVTWGAVLAAIAAIAMVLRASMTLSERRGRFVSAVTHELRTPLTTFCLYTDMLADGMVPDESARKRYLETLRGESKRLANIVESVLAYARLGRPRARNVEPIEVASILRRVEPALRQRVEQSGAVFDIDVDPTTLTRRVRGEEDSIERILVNLVDNACKYGIPDPGQPAHVTLDVHLDGGRIVFRVRDRGPGVPDAEQGRIFGAFQRGSAHRSHAQSGLGLGLALSKGLATEMDGDLILEPVQGPGACFALRLRLDQP